MDGFDFILFSRFCSRDRLDESGMSVGDGENINRTRNAAAAGDNKKKRVLNLVKRFYKLDAPSFKKEG